MAALAAEDYYKLFDVHEAALYESIKLGDTNAAFSYLDQLHTHMWNIVTNFPDCTGKRLLCCLNRAKDALVALLKTDKPT